MANYATKDDYAKYMFIELAQVPAGVERLLARSSELIEQAARNNIKVYNVSASMALNQADALKLATCAQVEYWLQAGEDSAIGRLIRSYSSGDISVTFADGETGSLDQLSKRSRGYLNKLGLLYKGLKSHVSYESGRYI